MSETRKDCACTWDGDKVISLCGAHGARERAAIEAATKNEPSSREAWQRLRRVVRQRCDRYVEHVNAWKDRETERNIYWSLEASNDAFRNAARLAVFNDALTTINALMAQKTRSIAELADDLTTKALAAATDVFPNSSSGTANLMKTYRVAALAEVAEVVRGHA